ncbi:MAG: ABC transporter substrate-binding protein [Actinomycetota bacterium]|nr:ABC transporter substrate-binding protein [Actinomycetota bacterium]
MISVRRWVALALFAVAFPACAINPSAVESSPHRLPRVGGTLTVASLEPESLDPVAANSRAAVLVLKQLCDTLVTFEPTTGRLVPDIAASWDVSPDARHFTFHLRTGIKFHNGREVTASDFVYSISRFVSAKTGSAQHFLFEKVAGYLDLRTDKTPTLSGVKAIGDKTLTVETSEPFAELPTILSNPTAGTAVPKEEVDKGSFGDAPSCTGPYMLAKPWEKGHGLGLTRYTAYQGMRPSMSRAGRGWYDRIEFIFGKSPVDVFKTLAAKKADVAEVPVDEIARAKRAGISVQAAANGLVSYIGLPVTRPPFNDPHFRVALDRSINRQAIVDGVLVGTRLIATGMLPPTAGPASKASDCLTSVPRVPDRPKAKRELTLSKIDPSKVTMTVRTNSDGGHEAWLRPLIKSWNESIGVTSTLRSDDWKVFLDILAGDGPDGPYRLAWSLKYPSPEAILDPLFSTGSLDNYERFSDSSFDMLMKKARATVSDSERAAIYARAASALCESVPILPIWFGVDHVGFRTSVVAAINKPTDLFGDPVLRELGR